MHVVVLGLVGQLREGQVCAERHNRFDVGAVDRACRLDHVLGRQHGVRGRTLAAHVAIANDLVAVRPEHRVQPRLDARVVRLHDRDLSFDAVRLQPGDDGIRGDGDGNIAAGHLADPALQLLAPFDRAAPHRQRRYAEDEGVGLGIHDPRDRILERPVDRLELPLEIRVGGHGIVGDDHAGQVIGHARRPHVVVLGLHDGVRRRRRHPESETPGQVVAHAFIPRSFAGDACSPNPFPLVLLLAQAFERLLAQSGEGDARGQRLGIGLDVDDGGLAGSHRTLEGGGEVGGLLDRLAMAAEGAGVGGEVGVLERGAGDAARQLEQALRHLHGEAVLAGGAVPRTERAQSDHVRDHGRLQRRRVHDVPHELVVRVHRLLRRVAADVSAVFRCGCHRHDRDEPHQHAAPEPEQRRAVLPRGPRDPDCCGDAVAAVRAGRRVCQGGGRAGQSAAAQPGGRQGRRRPGHRRRSREGWRQGVVGD